MTIHVLSLLLSNYCPKDTDVWYQNLTGGQHYDCMEVNNYAATCVQCEWQLQIVVVLWLQVGTVNDGMALTSWYLEECLSLKVKSVFSCVWDTFASWQTRLHICVCLYAHSDSSVRKTNAHNEQRQCTTQNTQRPYCTKVKQQFICPLSITEGGKNHIACIALHHVIDVHKLSEHHDTLQLQFRIRNILPV